MKLFSGPHHSLLDGLRILRPQFIDSAKLDCSHRTTGHARGHLALGQACLARIALVDLLFALGKTRHVIRTGTDASLAPDTLIVVLDDQTVGLFMVRLHGADLETRWVVTVVASKRQKTHGRRIFHATAQPDAVGQLFFFFTRDHASRTTVAACAIKNKSQLFHDYAFFTSTKVEQMQVALPSTSMASLVSTELVVKPSVSNHQPFSSATVPSRIAVIMTRALCSPRSL